MSGEVASKILLSAIHSSNKEEDARSSLRANMCVEMMVHHGSKFIGT